MAQDRNAYLHALSSNNAWACYKAHQNPDYFPKLADGEDPHILWVGCSDSHCPETTILGLQPGGVVVHRNMGNIISVADINTSAVIEEAVLHLGVRYIVLCGHTLCDAMTATLADSWSGGVLDTWLAPLRVIRGAHKEELDQLRDDKARAVRLAELNVQAGVEVLMENRAVQEAIRERGLEVHGCLFDASNGHIKDLGFGTKGHVNASPNEVVRGNHAQLVFIGGSASMSVL